MKRPFMRYVVDVVLDYHHCDIIFPGWVEDEKYGGCAIKFNAKYGKYINRKTAINIARELKIDIEIEEGDHLEILKYDEDYQKESKMDLTKCPNCGGPADNGHDRCYPPSPYWCTKCDPEIEDGIEKS